MDGWDGHRTYTVAANAWTDDKGRYSSFGGSAKYLLLLAVKSQHFTKCLYRDLDLGKSVCRTGWEGLDWIKLAQDRAKWWILVKNENKLSGFIIRVYLLTS